MYSRKTDCSVFYQPDLLVGVHDAVSVERKCRRKQGYWITYAQMLSTISGG